MSADPRDTEYLQHEAAEAARNIANWRIRRRTSSNEALRVLRQTCKQCASRAVVQMLWVDGQA